MKKMMFSVFALMTILALPTTAFASETNTTTEKPVEMVMNMDCTDQQIHIQMIKEHRLNVINQLKNGEISQAHFVHQIKHVNEMVNMHK